MLKPVSSARNRHAGGDWGPMRHIGAMVTQSVQPLDGQHSAPPGESSGSFFPSLRGHLPSIKLPGGRSGLSSFGKWISSRVSSGLPLSVDTQAGVWFPRARGLGAAS